MKKYKVCPTCGKKFTKNYFYSQRYWSKQIYCSIECSGTLFKRTGRVGKCDSCGKIIWILPCKDKSNKTGKHFCSRKCADRMVGKLKTGYHHTEETKKRIREARAKQIISPEIYKQNGLKMRGKNHWNWKGGISKSPACIYGDGWREIRMSVYKRDNYTCQKCKIKCSGKAGKDLIQCHHKKPWRVGKDNAMKNLITLCLSCHVKEDFRYDKNTRDIKRTGGF